MNKIAQAIIEKSNGNNQPLESVIKELTEQRDQLLQIANQQLARLNGQIEQLQSILDDGEVEERRERDVKA